MINRTFVAIQVATRSASHHAVRRRAMAQSKLRHLLVLDFEATCGDEIKGQNEIIEFPTLVYNLENDEVQATFHEYVRPVVHPRLTRFCTNLTGITQDVVDAADTFPEVRKRFQDFLKQDDLLGDPSSYAFLTCGEWDLQVMLPRQLVTSNIDHGLDESGKMIPPYNRYINVKKAFRKHYKLRYEQGMAPMLRHLRMPLEGRHHSGIDDCKNILAIVRRMREDGWKPEWNI